MRSMYLVLDMINDFVHANGPMASAGLGQSVRSRDLIAKTKEMIARARSSSLSLGFVRVGFSDDYRECPPSSPIFSAIRDNGLLKLSGWGSAVHAELDHRPDDFDIVKHRISPFYGTGLESILRANAIDRIYVSGVSTVGAVESTVRDGHDRDYECVVIEDCCAASSDVEHAAAMEGVQRFARVVTTETIEFE